jgi:RNA polymerase sigma factor (sigma-70 family)
MVKEGIESATSTPSDFKSLFIEQFPLVRRTVARVVGYGPAEDVAVEAFARAYARWDSVGSMEYPLRWIFRVATNLALDQTRRKNRWAPAKPMADVEDEVANRQALLAPLRRLPRRQQQVVVLRYIADLSEEEVARVLGVSLGTVKTHLRRAMPRLRSELITLEGGEAR